MSGFIRATAFCTALMCGANCFSVSIRGFSVSPDRIFHNVVKGTPDMRANSCSPAWPKGASRSRKSKSRGGVLLMGCNPIVNDRLLQPQTEEKINYLSGMPIYDGKTVLWKNVSTRMVTLWGKENLTRLANESGIGPATCTRIKNQETSTGIDVLEKIAKVLKVTPWQLISPDMEDTKPTTNDIQALQKIYNRVPASDKVKAIHAAMLAMLGFVPDSSPATPEQAQADQGEKPSAKLPTSPASSNTH